jgi:hypothetical protein
MQARITAGEVIDIFPYRQARRLHVAGDARHETAPAR